jgi:lipid A ethanolaminephosphotransferase
VLGYDRDTTPNLAKQQGLLAFSDVHSCGTETAVSVPCMFSGMTRKDYDARVAKNREGLLDILQRAGLAVQWRDNQSGCKAPATACSSSTSATSRTRNCAPMANA